ncbi:MAG: DNA-binding transcriptional LysR family regulator [Bradymonadia bacterium]|jgi:DNA-binding transcriptional LysR family regulator
MTDPTFTLDQLRVLDAIARAGTFAGAAQTLHRVPSAISYTMRQLEQSLGVALFDRSGHGAQWTPAGRRLLEEGRGLLTGAERIAHLARTLGDGWAPSLSLVVDGGFPIAPIMRGLRRFNAHGAPTRVQVHVEYQDGVLARFERDRVDLMLMLAFDGTGDWHAESLPDLGMSLVVAPDHPLATGTVDQARLRSHVELVVRDSAPAFKETPRSAWFGSEQVVYLPDFHSKDVAIRSGAGYGWLPDWLADPGLASEALARVPFAEGNQWTYHPQIIHRRSVPLGRAGDLFLTELRAEIAAQLDPATDSAPA